MYIATALVIFSIILTFCSEDIKQEYEKYAKERKQEQIAQQIQQLEGSGKTPKLERTNSLAGIDKNNNGIRDDVEAYIEKNYPKEVQKAAKQFARSMQKSVLVGASGDRELAREVGLEASYGLEGIHSKYEEHAPASKIILEVEAITTNTYQRLKAYDQYNRLLSGTTWTSLPAFEDGCDEEDD